MSTYKTLSDKELVDLMKSGDHVAFTEIYNRYWGLMYVHALKMLSDEDEAKDIIQDLFITVWSKRSNLDLNTNLSGYLYISTRHKILNKIRQRKTSDNFINALALYINDSENSIIDDIREKELTIIINKEIEKLPLKMRRIFEMSRKQYLSHKEIAEELDISDKTVKKQINNAIKILKLKQGLLKGVLIWMLTSIN